MCHIDVSYIVSKLIFNACSLSVVASVVLVDVIKDVSTRQLQGIKTMLPSQTARQIYHKKNQFKNSNNPSKEFLVSIKTHFHIHFWTHLCEKRSSGSQL